MVSVFPATLTTSQCRYDRAVGFVGSGASGSTIINVNCSPKSRRIGPYGSAREMGPFDGLRVV